MRQSALAMKMDPDLKIVADAVDGDAEAAAALMRLAAKSGNPAMQAQVLNYNAERRVGRCNPPGLAAGSAENEMDAMVLELENQMSAAESRGTDEAGGATGAAMCRYLSKQTKMRETFAKFYAAFRVDDVPRRALGEFLSREPNVLLKSSANKLFFPPKGFEVALFERSGNDVRLSREWVAAWETMSHAGVDKQDK